MLFLSSLWFEDFTLLIHPALMDTNPYTRTLLWTHLSFCSLRMQGNTFSRLNFKKKNYINNANLGEKICLLQFKYELQHSLHLKAIQIKSMHTRGQMTSELHAVNFASPLLSMGILQNILNGSKVKSPSLAPRQFM